MQTDFLIVGQGLCGSWLSYYLLREGASVRVIDKGTGSSASAAASGIINPVTGKRLARQWMGDVIFPFAQTAYSELGRELGETLAEETSIHTFFSTAEEAQLFEQKAAKAEDEILHYGTHMDPELFNSHYGIGTVHPAMLVDVRALLEGWRAKLRTAGILMEENFDWKECLLEEYGVSYKNIRSNNIIDCTGAASATNPYFSRLPFALNKGEAILATIPALPQAAIYKYAQLSIVPWVDDQFWIGSTFDWDFTDELPTTAFRQKAEAILRQWLRLPYTMGEHFAAIRPATVTRDAFSGMHPLYPQLGMLNGMGSKGCSLAPFLAHNLAQHLVRGMPLIPQVDVGRYARVLSR